MKIFHASEARSGEVGIWREPAAARLRKELRCPGFGIDGDEEVATARRDLIEFLCTLACTGSRRGLEARHGAELGYVAPFLGAYFHSQSLTEWCGRVVTMAAGSFVIAR